MPQETCVMSALKALKTCPIQRNNFLTTLGDLDYEHNNIITFKKDDFKVRLSHQLDFQLSTKYFGNTIFCTILDEGASTSVMSLSCWRAIGSPQVNCPPTTLKAFDVAFFKLKDYFPLSR